MSIKPRYGLDIDEVRDLHTYIRRHEGDSYNYWCLWLHMAGSSFIYEAINHFGLIMGSDLVMCWFVTPLWCHDESALSIYRVLQLLMPLAPYMVWHHVDWLTSDIIDTQLLERLAALQSHVNVWLCVEAGKRHRLEWQEAYRSEVWGNHYNIK